jgi:hypothetical protein
MKKRPPMKEWRRQLHVSGNVSGPRTPPYASHRICPFRITFIASYPAIVRNAGSTNRDHRPAAIRFFYESVILLQNII